MEEVCEIVSTLGGSVLEASLPNYSPGGMKAGEEALQTAPRGHLDELARNKFGIFL